MVTEVDQKSTRQGPQETRPRFDYSGQLDRTVWLLKTERVNVTLSQLLKVVPVLELNMKRSPTGSDEIVAASQTSNPAGNPKLTPHKVTKITKGGNCYLDVLSLWSGRGRMNYFGLRFTFAPLRLCVSFYFFGLSFFDCPYFLRRCSDFHPLRLRFSRSAKHLGCWQ